MDEVLNEGVVALKSIGQSRDKLSRVVTQMQSAADDQKAVLASLHDLSELLEQNERVLTKLETSHARLMDAVQAEWRDTRESIRDRIDNTLAQIQQQATQNQAQTEASFEALSETFLAQAYEQTEALIAEMPRGLFGRRGKREAAS